MPGPDERFRRSVIAAATWEQRHGYARPGARDTTEAQIVRLRRTIRAARTGRTGLPWSPAHQELVDTHWPGAWKDPSRAPGYVHRDTIARQRAETDEQAAREAAARAAVAKRRAAQLRPRALPGNFEDRVRAAAGWEAEHGRRASSTSKDRVERAVAALRSRLLKQVAGAADAHDLTPAGLAFLDQTWPTWRSTPSTVSPQRAARDEETFRARVLAAAAWEAEHGRPVTRSQDDAVEHFNFRTRLRASAAGHGRMKLTAERVAFLDEHWPSWRAPATIPRSAAAENSRLDRFRTRVQAAATWEAARRRRATFASTDPAERAVAQLGSDIRAAVARGALPGRMAWDDERLAVVRELWPDALEPRVGAVVRRGESLHQRILAAAAWEDENGHAFEDGETPDERGVATLRSRLGRASKGLGPADRSRKIEWTPELEAFVAEHWPAVLRNQRAASPEDRFRAQVLAAAKWEAEHGHPARYSHTDSVERSVHLLRRTIREARSGRAGGQMNWTPEREAFVAKHWPVETLRPPAPGAGRPRDDETFQARVLAAAAWEAKHGRAVTRRIASCRPLAVLREHMRRAAAGTGAIAWTPEREAFADEHWPAWRAQP